MLHYPHMQAHVWIPLALLSALFGALVAVFGKMGLEKVDTTLATTVRAGVMFLFLLVVILAMGKFGEIGTLTGRTALYIVLAGIAGALSWIFYFWALKVGKASQIAPLDRLSIVFVIALAALFLGEKIVWKTAIGTALMVIGAIMIALA